MGGPVMWSFRRQSGILMAMGVLILCASIVHCMQLAEDMSASAPSSDLSTSALVDGADAPATLPVITTMEELHSTAISDLSAEGPSQHHNPTASCDPQRDIILTETENRRVAVPIGIYHSLRTSGDTNSSAIPSGEAKNTLGSSYDTETFRPGDTSYNSSPSNDNNASPSALTHLITHTDVLETSARGDIHSGTGGLFPAVIPTVVQSLAQDHAWSPSAAHTHSPSAAVGVSMPCLLGAHSIINDTKFLLKDESEERLCLPLPVNTWIRFVGTDWRPLEVLAFNATVGYCMQTNYCGSRYPWYIYTSDSTTDDSSVALCMTDTTIRGTALCCQQPVKVSVKQCDSFKIYKLLGPIPMSACGGICLTDKAQAGTDEWLSENLTVSNLMFLPKALTSLDISEKSSLVTVKIAIEPSNHQQFKERNFMAAFRQRVLEVLNEHKTLSRYKRFLKPNKLQQHMLRPLRGTPVRIGLYVYFTFYIQEDNGSIMPLQLLVMSLKDLEFTDVARDQTSHVREIIAGIPAEISPILEREVVPRSAEMTDSTTSEELITSELSKPAEDRTWIAILVIIGSVPILSLMVITAFCLHVWCGARKWGTMKWLEKNLGTDNQEDGIRLQFETSVYPLENPAFLADSVEDPAVAN